MRRLAFRTGLPIAILAVSVLLMVLSEAEQSATRHRQFSDDGTVAGWDIVTDDNRIPTVGGVALVALNAPALLVAVIPISLLDPLEQTWIYELIVALAILLQWFLIGLAIDRRLAADLTIPALSPSLGRKVLVWIGLVLSGFFAAVSLGANVVGGSGLSPELWLGFWFALIALILWRRIQAWRKSTADSVTTLQLVG